MISRILLLLLLASPAFACEEEAIISRLDRLIQLEEQAQAASLQQIGRSIIGLSKDAAVRFDLRERKALQALEMQQQLDAMRGGGL